MWSGRLDELAIGSTVTADYTYDGLERLAIRTTSNMTPAGTTHYLYDRAGHLLVEADDTGQTLREYVWLDDMPLAVVSDVNTMSPNLYFVHADHLDTPVRMTDGSKAVVWDAYFLAFGAVESITGSASNNLRFPGQYFLIEDGLHYNWYRHYDPTVGRYIQSDPLGFVDGPSVYAYANSHPQEEVDSDGRQGSIGIAIQGSRIAWLCAQHPILCAGTAAAAATAVWNYCRQAITGIGGGGGGGGRGDGGSDSEKQAQSDEAVCRSLRKPDVRARCYESANSRFGACGRGLPLPPLVTW